MQQRGEKAQDEGRGLGSTGKGRYKRLKGYKLGSVAGQQINATLGTV